MDPLTLQPGGAWSLRLLRAAYTGPAVQVRRSSDNALEDIAFDAHGHFDGGAFSAFVGSGDGFVHTWYDQSGNGRHAVQTNTARQPQIALNAINGCAAVRFDGEDDILPLSAGLDLIRALNSATFVFVASTAHSYSVYFNVGMTDTMPSLIIRGGNNQITEATTRPLDAANPIWSVAAGGLYGTGHHIIATTFDWANGAIYIWRDGGNYGESLGNNNAGTRPDTDAYQINLGANRETRFYIDGDITEFLAYQAALSDEDRQFLEANHAAYYGLTLAS